MERNTIEPTVIGSYNIKAICSYINIKPSSKLERLERKLKANLCASGCLTLKMKLH